MYLIFHFSIKKCNNIQLLQYIPEFLEFFYIISNTRSILYNIHKYIHILSI